MTQLNPYEATLVEKGYSLREIRRPGKTITLENAKAQGFETVAGYEQAIHDFLNEQ